MHSIFVSWALRPFVRMKFSYSCWPLRVLWLTLYLSHAFHFRTEAAGCEIYENNMHTKYSGFTVCVNFLLLLPIFRWKNIFVCSIYLTWSQAILVWLKICGSNLLFMCRKFDKSTDVLHPIPVQPEVWDMIDVDLIVPLPETPRGHKYIITASCYFSKWPEAAALPTKEATGVAEFLYKCFMRHGCCRVKISDQGREFVNKVSGEDRLLFSMFMNVQCLKLFGAAAIWNFLEPQQCFCFPHTLWLNFIGVV